SIFVEANRRYVLDWLCLFFFQAEDGIRDFHVTGVQTCALPIWACTISTGRGAMRCTTASGAKSYSASMDSSVISSGMPSLPGSRSEERRVGKDGRACLWGRHEDMNRIGDGLRGKIACND